MALSPGIPTYLPQDYLLARKDNILGEACMGMSSLGYEAWRDLALLQFLHDHRNVALTSYNYGGCFDIIV